MDEKKIKVLAVVGPTATGKSALAAGLALRLGGEVVSADSMQIYKGMDIGTAKPTALEMRGVPHHLIGFARADTAFNVSDYVNLAGECIAQIAARGKLPVLVGGTGLYVRSLLTNISFLEESKDEALRERLAQTVKEAGTAPLLEELRELDPESAERIDPKNPVRLIRAIEICRVSGTTMTQRLAASRLAPTPYDACVIGLDFEDRQKLYARIDARVDAMLAAGLVEEARAVLSSTDVQTARQAIGYKEFAPYFAGEITLEQAAEAVKRESRRYAKRQRTWFYRDEGTHWLMADTLSASALADEAEKIAHSAGI